MCSTSSVPESRQLIDVRDLEGLLRPGPARSPVHPAAEVIRRLEDWRNTRWNRTASPVLGLRAVRALRRRALKVPKPPDFDVVASARVVLHGIEEGIDHQSAIPLGDPWSDRIGDLRNEVGFRHPVLLARSVARFFTLL